jgi:hypothetical protein
MKRSLFRRQEFIQHDATVVVNDSPAHAAVVILAMEACAPARELDATRDEILVTILVVFAVRQLPAWSRLTLEAAA